MRRTTSSLKAKYEIDDKNVTFNDVEEEIASDDDADFCASTRKKKNTLREKIKKLRIKEKFLSKKKTSKESLCARCSAKK